MRILFASGPGAGHIGPLLPFARAARKAGHEVILAAPASAAGTVARAGLVFQPLPEAPDRAQRWAPVFNGHAPGLPYVLQELFIGLDARHALPGMLLAVEDWRPELIVRESCEFASVIAAERARVPLRTIGIHLASAIDCSPQLHALAAPALERLGLNDMTTLTGSPVSTCAPRSLQDADQPVTRFRAPAPTNEEDVVYVTFGSQAHDAWRYDEAEEALAGLNVLTSREWIDPPRARVTVCHGGSGSTLQALASGTPIAFIPLFVDGPDNARRVVEAGAGLIVDGLRATVERLLEEQTFRIAARRIQAEIATLPEPAL
jgi:hypothetical protein